MDNPDISVPVCVTAIIVIITLFILVIANTGAKFCPECGERYMSNTIYCPRCGVELLERGK